MKALFLIFLSVLYAHCSFSQQIKLSQGLSITTYDYKNNLGESITSLKSGSGIAFQISVHKPKLVNLAKFQVSQKPFAIYLTKNKFLANVLSHMNYDVGAQFNQLNAVGDITPVAFSYETDFVGLFGKLGFRVQMPFQVAFNLQGIFSINKIVHGNQLLANRYLDLTIDPMFSGVKVISGYGFEIEKSFTDKLVGHFSYQKGQTIGVSPVNNSTLNFSPALFSVGLRINN
jgi:hypothetical protein